MVLFPTNAKSNPPLRRRKSCESHRKGEVFMRKMSLKRITAAALAGMMAVGMFTACGGSEESESADLSYAEKKVLRVGMECAYAPFNWTQETTEVSNGDTALPIYGQNTYAYGYDVMMAKKIADHLGWDVEIHKVEWDSIGMSLDANEYDCIIGGMSWNEEREASYDFSNTYYNRATSITVRKDSDYASAQSLDDLAGKGITVTTQLATAWIDHISDIPDAVAVVNYATTSECFMAVSNGVADACMIDTPTSESALLTNDDLVILPFSIDIGDGSNCCIAVREGDSELQGIINDALEAINWNEDEMNAMMSEAVACQPAAN